MKSRIEAVGLYEPTLGVRFLPRCAACGARHPLACRPALPEGRCPGCGTALAAAPAGVEVPAVLTGWRPWAVLARLCFALAGVLARFWRSRQ